MKTVQSYQEIGNAIDQGKTALCTRVVTATVTVQQDPESDTVQVIVLVSRGDRNIGFIQTEFSSMTDVLEVFDIDDLEEIWEVL